LEKSYLGMKNILFIAPHPDDELVGAALIIKKILKKKKCYNFFSYKWFNFTRKNVAMGKIRVSTKIKTEIKRNEEVY